MIFLLVIQLVAGFTLAPLNKTAINRQLHQPLESVRSNLEKSVTGALTTGDVGKAVEMIGEAAKDADKAFNAAQKINKKDDSKMESLLAAARYLLATDIAMGAVVETEIGKVLWSVFQKSAQPFNNNNCSGCHTFL